MKKFYYSIILLFVATSLFAQDAKKDYSQAFNLIEVWLEAQKDFEEIPALSAVVVEDQQVLWTGAFGLANIEEGVKAEPSTRYSICSISKLFTSVAIMKLYDEGKLRLDDRIEDLLPWYNLQQKFPESGPVTIRSLLTHSSGLPREADYAYWTGPDFPFPTPEQLKSKLGNQETLYPSSTYLQYSNLGISLLGQVIEEISGLSYDEYVTRNILKPLGLDDTQTTLPEKFYGDKLAIGYSGKTREGVREKVNFFQAKGIKPAAGYSSTVHDLGKFASWQFRLMDGVETEILKSSTLRYMQNVHWIDPDFSTTWGLGFEVYKGANGKKWVCHGGACPGYSTTLQMEPKSKMAYSVMINASGVRPKKYVEGINAIMKKVEAPVDKVKEKKFEEYVGYYSLKPWGGEFYVSGWGDKLVILSLPSDLPGKSMAFYKHIEGDTFRRIRKDDELGARLTFERDGNNKVIRAARNGRNYSVKIDR